MLSLFGMLLALLVAAPPAASPAPTATPILTEIVHVRTSPLCSDFSTHANSLIGSATRNDQQLSQLIVALRVDDEWTSNDLRRRRRILEYTAYADQITAEWKRGESEAARLRELAKRTTDKDEQAAIVGTADALAGAMWRQRKIARDLDGFIAYLYTEDIAKIHDGGEAQMNKSVYGNADPLIAAATGSDGSTAPRVPPSMAQGIWTPGEVIPGRDGIPDTLRAKSAATAFEGELPDVLRDERTAADRVKVASEHC